MQISLAKSAPLLLSSCALILLAGCDGSESSTSMLLVEPDAIPTDGQTEAPSDPPNLLLIIADDQGLDASAQYALSDDVPNTPVIDSLATDGIVFDNAWATPACTTTRGNLVSDPREETNLISESSVNTERRGALLEFAANVRSGAGQGSTENTAENLLF